LSTPSGLFNVSDVLTPPSFSWCERADSDL
jgi:hypothetical protein